MHDEDNKYGLRVTNLRGDKWMAYGDGMLLEGKSRDNLRIVVKAVQISVDQVYEAYSYPTKALDPSMVTELIPFIDIEETNNAPLFQVKDGKVHRRSNINDLQDTSTTENWWGLTTLVKITMCCYKPRNSSVELKRLPHNKTKKRHISVTVREKEELLYLTLKNKSLSYYPQPRVIFSRLTKGKYHQITRKNSAFWQINTSVVVSLTLVLFKFPDVQSHGRQTSIAPVFTPEKFLAFNFALV